ncbi:MAG TPA: c-type cytochrome [Steroidobacteraceae bacterium]|jgi:mono/diheme cytochrome c family protein
MPDPSSPLRLAWAVAAATLLAGMPPSRAQSPQDNQDFTQIERGRYLAIAADCAACHTNPHDQRAFAGGRPIQTPFGMVLSANITPDRETGIGAWSDAQFDAALRGGRMPNGSRLYPAMPYPYFTRMSRDDVRALRAYLNTLEPVHHRVETDQLPFPFNVRTGMSLWDALYFHPGELQADATKSEQWNRGAYLVEGAGHCGACHTPKTWLGGDRSGRQLHGYSEQDWFGPNITGDEHRGIGGWSQNDVVEYLKTGHNRFAAASGPMAEEVADSSSRMNSADLQAIASYLKDQPGQRVAVSALSPFNPAMIAGAAIYQDLCSACHKADGTGVPYLIPNLAQTASIASREPTSLIHVVLRGATTVSTADEPTAPAMPAFGDQLTDQQVAAVITYVRNSWGHAAAALSAGEVHAARQTKSARHR